MHSWILLQFSNISVLGSLVSGGDFNAALVRSAAMASFPDNTARFSLILLPLEFAYFALDEFRHARLWLFARAFW